MAHMSPKKILKDDFSKVETRMPPLEQYRSSLNFPAVPEANMVLLLQDGALGHELGQLVQMQNDLELFGLDNPDDHQPVAEELIILENFNGGNEGNQPPQALMEEDPINLQDDFDEDLNEPNEDDEGIEQGQNDDEAN